MNNADRVHAALKALREADAHLGAPESLEARLRAAHRARTAPRRSYALYWAGAAAAAIAMIFMIRASRLPEILPMPEVRLPQASAPAFAWKKFDLPAAPKPVLAASRPRPAVQSEVSDFMPLPYAPPLTVYDHGQVVRVRLPRTSIRSFGLLVNEDRIGDRIPADVLLGQDGIPRAIRFVNTSR